LKKSGKELHYEARKAILDYLDERSIEPRNQIEFFGTETSFKLSLQSNYGQARREIFFDALEELNEKGLITASSPLNELPIRGLRLTPKGLKRPRNPIEAYKDDGIKAGLAAIMSSIGRYLTKKFEG
jgi:hypothetical protein|tara:strand:+ start:1974 stop:2354 length:381 start_codon:yes stop_codon:yes gene_type:complete